ncbi:MAG TPA: hypothetical protein VD969_17310 [Symbiobacteriaceae bacterium]|nr:hypothetical protein [Symbiobacteriaceae bacterium]
MDLESFSAAAREFYQQGQYGALVAYTGVVLDHITQEAVSPEAEAAVRLWRGNGYYGLGRQGSAVSCYNEALSLVVEDEAPVLASQILTSLMTVYAATPEYQEFDTLHNRYQALCQGYPTASRWSPWVLYNKGVCLEWSMNLEAAVSAYEDCLRACANTHLDGVADLTAAALSNATGVYLQLGRFKDAKECLAADRSGWSVERRAMMEIYEARCLVLTGEVSRARAVIANVKDFPGLSEATMAEFCLTSALCHKAEGNTSAARTAAYQAVDYAYKARPEHAAARDSAIRLLRSLSKDRTKEGIEE